MESGPSDVSSDVRLMLYQNFFFSFLYFMFSVFFFWVLSRAVMVKKCSL